MKSFGSPSVASVTYHSFAAASSSSAGGLGCFATHSDVKYGARPVFANASPLVAAYRLARAPSPGVSKMRLMHILYATWTTYGSVLTTPVTMFPGCTVEHRTAEPPLTAPPSPSFTPSLRSSSRVNWISASLLCAYAALAPYYLRSNPRSSSRSLGQNWWSLLHTNTTLAGAEAVPAFLSEGMSRSARSAGARKFVP